MNLKMFLVNIESYGGILLYFCEIGNMKKYLTLVYMTPINGYKLNKYEPCQWVIVIDKYGIVNKLQ